jgi:hypothetical protein
MKPPEKLNMEAYWPLTRDPASGSTKNVVLKSN